MSETTKLQFILRGFTHATGCRIFEFEGVGRDHSRTLFAVRANVTMARTHRIPLQDLPLLCKALLERRYTGDEQRAFEFEEAEMRLHQQEAEARSAAAKARKPPRRPTSPAVGASWRGHQPWQ